MDGFRSKSCGDGRNQIQSYYYGGGARGPIPSSTSSVASTATSMQDLRCYSASYASSVYPTTQTQMGAANSNDFKFKKGGSKSTNGSAAPSKSWSFNDPELQRKRRVAGYKVYAVEGKVKGSFKKSFRWLKERCTRAVYGWW
uniref:DUF3511 domain-containing protein n=1 Tax=Rhizophora mucronata TaxID=61149 RepID=A0A2P2Q888_RHIMU